MTPRVLVVDDDEGVRYTLRGILEDAGFEVSDAPDGASALAAYDDVDEGHHHLVLTDLRMPEMDGLELLRRLRERALPPKVILITAHGSERTAVEAMKVGAFDYFRKPFEPEELLAVVQRATDSVRLSVDNAQLSAELALSRSMVFASASMKRLALMVQRIASKNVTVLITGESGTGKERLAEAIVRASSRSHAPFVRFNCAALALDLADAELFGHDKGAFTGASVSRRGLFREANGGTLFLDEIAELDLGTQAKLLRVLQEGEVRPVGRDRPEKVDVRILAATHRDLEQRVDEGRFREDLFYRLKVVSLNLPPLRERPEDVEVLARRFVGELSERFGVGPFEAGSELLAHLESRAWPGNVRELRNALESLIALSPPDRLDLTLLEGSGTTSLPSATLDERLRAYERGLLISALRASEGNRTEAAKALGIGRTTLYEKIQRFGLADDDET